MSDRTNAREQLKNLTILGLTVLVIGAVTAAVSSPGVKVSTDLFGPSTVATGSQTWYDIGLIAAGLGSTVLWVGLTGWGVYLGVRAARTD